MPPNVPVATYRLQLTPSFGFDEAAKLVPYLQGLGISHVYLSPCLKARSGSTHGYDVVDYGALNPELGGEQGFLRLSDALARSDMGLILDFVSNHMAVHGADNRWWLDVLEWGRRSPYAASFDIDWTALPGRPRVLVPILGSSYGAALESGDIRVRYDASEGSLSAWYHEHRLPIRPDDYPQVLRKIIAAACAEREPAGARILQLLARCKQPRHITRDEAASLKTEFAAIKGGKDTIERGLKAYQSGQPLHRLLERQHYRLAHWRLAASELNYRRFFDITSLAGLRVEDRATFDAAHALVGRLTAQGRVHGLRLDHIDGLYDPAQYFARLQDFIRSQQPDPNRPLYVIVEKILAEGERLPELAGVAGATGYEALNLISRVLLDPRGLAGLELTWQQQSGDRCGFDEILRSAKCCVLETMLTSEFEALVRLLSRIAAGRFSTRDYPAARLRAALKAFILEFPVYRTYVGSCGLSQDDRAIIDATIDRARANWSGPAPAIFDFLRDALTLDLIKRPGHSAVRVRRFAAKVQQFTGPMMAKSLEDTAFYRYHRLLALNEVGGNPAAAALPINEFHDAMQERASRCPHGLTASATHDTKRGEDARARLLGLSELAEDWAQAVQEWQSQNAHLITGSGARRIPSPAHETMLYQALLGAWPLAGIDADFIGRVQSYAVKAAREGKEQTSWIAVDENYEAGLRNFLGRLLDRTDSARFIESFTAFVRRAALIGALKSLAQITLKLTVPGVPDFYQGTELWDLSLVDPDNRRSVDFEARALAARSIPDEPDWRSLVADWTDGRVKLALTRRVLAFRKQAASVFTDGSYRRLEVTGPDRNEILAFARVRGRNAAVVIVGTSFARATENGRKWPQGSAWDASLITRDLCAVQNMLAPAGELPVGELPVSQLFTAVPVAVLEARQGG